MRIIRSLALCVFAAACVSPPEDPARNYLYGDSRRDSYPNLMFQPDLKAALASTGQATEETELLTTRAEALKARALALGLPVLTEAERLRLSEDIPPVE